jgi:signal transduction histidine kinase/CheY-like chemotaxis protein
MLRVWSDHSSGNRHIATWLTIAIVATVGSAVGSWTLGKDVVVFGGLAAMVLAISILFFKQFSDREAAALEVQTRNMRFDTALKNMTHGLSMFDAEKRLVVCNDRYAKMYQLPPELVQVGTPFAEIVKHRELHGILKDEKCLGDVDQKTSGRQQAGETKSWIYELADGRLLHVTRGPMAGGGWVSTHEDITERRHYVELKEAHAAATAAEAEARRAVAAAEDASRAKSTFLANVSHEIRTPMNGVFGMTDLLMRTELSERQQRLVNTINQSAKSLLTIINDILDVSRIEAGKLVLDCSEFHLRESIEETVDLLAETAQKKGLELTLLVAPEVPARVIGDAGRVRQVCTNIIANAVKFTQVGEIDIVVSYLKAVDGVANVEFKVRDTGIGIPAHVKQRLFQPFQQADTSISRRFGGTGLGLAITKHLVEMMGGEITLVSEPGVGSEFTIRLPLSIGAEGPSGHNTVGSLLNGARILVLDDRAKNREIIASYLNESGAEATCVATPDDALAALSEAQRTSHAFDLAIIDMVLPGTNGLDVAKLIKAEPAMRRVRLMMLTSLSWKGDMQTAREHGFLALLTKPIHRKELVATVARTLELEERAGTADADLPRKTAQQEQPDRIATRVLVAEDNPVNVEVAREYLGNLNCAITVAGNGVEAVTAFGERRFDVILMDCQMPEMDGLTATRRIRKSERMLGMEPTPIIAVTANAFAEDRANCLAAGMDDYLSKPFTEAQLEHVLSKWSKQSVSETGSAKSGPTIEATAIAASDGSKPSERKGAGRNLKNRAAVPQALVANATGRLDKDVVGRLKNGHPGLLARLIETYLRVAPELLSQLVTAAADNNQDVLRATAHSLKSSSANVGASKLSDLCRQLEHLLATNRQAEAAEWRPIVAGIGPELAATTKELAAIGSTLREGTTVGVLMTARA